MIVKLNEPKITHPSIAVDSYWVAAYNYIRFKYERQDAYYVAVTDSGGFARFDMSYIAVTPGISPMLGDVIYVSGDDYGTTCVVTVIDSITVSGHPSIGIVTDLPFNVNATGFINCISERANWRMEARIKVNAKTIANTIYRALPDGTLWVEVQEFIKSYLDNTYAYSDTGFNAIDNPSGIPFVLEHRQVFEGFDTEDFTIEDTFYAVNAAMQPSQPNAPNLLNYVVFNDNNNAKFLCGFAEPTVWVGYPFSLSYLWNDEPGDLSLLEAWYDINRTQVDITNQGTITANPGKVNTLGLLRGVVTSNPYSYMSATLLKDAFPYDAATETKMVRVKTPCGKNEVMLVWRNQLGGWDYYLFDKNYTEELTTSNGNVFEPWIEDMGDAQTMQSILSKTAYETMHLVAGNLDANDMQGLKGLLKSIAVYIIDTATPYNTTRVVIEPASWVVTDTKSLLNTLEFTVRKPNEFIQHS